MLGDPCRGRVGINGVKIQPFEMLRWWRVSQTKTVLMKTVLIVFAAAGVLAGCGVRGTLDRPSASASGEPAPIATADADSGQGKKADAAAKPHQGFFLDWLLK